MFNLGDRVTMSGTVSRRRKASGLVFYATDPAPTQTNTGIVIGKRTAREGQVVKHDNGVYFSPTEGKTQTVWLVAYSLHRKPVMCLTEQLHVAND